MIDGNNIIYHYIQKTLLSDNANDKFSKELIERLIIDLSIWFPPNVYQELPLLLPYVIRDASCRQKQANGKHEWGFSNTKGFLRDDNSLIKGIISPLQVKSNKIKEYNNKKLSVGFVASHIWRKLKGKDFLASTFEKTNSFVPNLVWLPKQISKLTDREGSYAQQILQALSYKIYFNNTLTDFTKEIWQHLEVPSVPAVDNIDINKLNYFIAPDIWIEKKKTMLKKEINIILQTLDSNNNNTTKVKCSSYLPSLVERIEDNEKGKFKDWLNSNLKQIN
ncbi:hypothetical protein ACFSKU_08845 [Pontibacter silvestris]|uniref:Uncharacterized protein n=1 Tax=Pontibacter silvestris TaxID=2305183 RepID=A0ABW4WX68_9BACT|nr:hypothetical protein [Pontibacter silvestris]MCC9138935.1 hypothetical protein [Pontibacter silvestris]